MKYSYKLISGYIDGNIGKEELLSYLELLGLNPVITAETEDDAILELETPANRGDLLSLVGVARAVMPFTAYRLKLPGGSFRENLPEKLPVGIEDEKDCFYYSCRIIRNINVSVHSGWLGENIEKLGYRSSFSVVDISNYVMAETGQPLHIFDLDRVEGGIRIRRAKKGESIVTIDGKKRELDEEIMVIADERKVIALAGIMGGENSEVKGGTKNILIESAVFNPVVVRRGGRKLGLATEASARFERGLDLETSRNGMTRSACLVGEICGGDVGSLSEAGRMKEQKADVQVDAGRIARVAGLEIDKKFIMDVLTKLDFKVKTQGDVYTVAIPSYRKDIREDVDIIEEIVKYKKYSEFPSELPSASLRPTPSSREIDILEKIKDTAVKLGFTEVINMGITSRENAKLGMSSVPAGIENPLSANLGFLRTGLIPEMLENARFNVNHEVRRLDIFELGKIYHEENGSFVEEHSLAFITVNSGDFLNFKGRIEKLLESSGLEKSVYRMQADASYGNENLDIYLGGVRIGHIFILQEQIKTVYDIKKEKIYGGEIFLEKIMNEIFPAETGFREPPRYPSSARDFSFILPEEITWQEIENIILSLNLPVEKVEFFDLYKGAGVPQCSVSVSFSVVFRYPDKTLENEEVSMFSEKIIDAVCGSLKGKLRGASADL